MSKQNLRPKTYDRFKSVEAVATQIFENMPELGQTDQSQGANAGEGSSNIVSIFGGAAKDAGGHRTQTQLLWGALVNILQERNSKALAVLSNQSQHFAETGAVPRETVNSPDISYHAARRRSHLPEGIELIKGKPSIRSDDEMLRSIRELVHEQEVERREADLAKKRELSRQKLPSLPPQATEMPTTDKVIKPSLVFRARLRLKRVFINDLFMASSLSIWFALTTMTFIDPALSTGLCFTSVFLLFVAYCLSASDCMRRSQRKL